MVNKNIFIKKNFGIEKSGSIILTTVVQGTDVIVSSNPLCKKRGMSESQRYPWNLGPINDECIFVDCLVPCIWLRNINQSNTLTTDKRGNLSIVL